MREGRCCSDSATINVGVVVNNMPSSEEAQKELAAQNNKILSAVKNTWHRKKDIKTTDIRCIQTIVMKTM